MDIVAPQLLVRVFEAVEKDSSPPRALSPRPRKQHLEAARKRPNPALGGLLAPSVTALPGAPNHRGWLSSDHGGSVGLDLGW
jgi:hypothetical protein